eukprot:gnl/MRDRNA2_/MRDRNA2_115864_c0_seq1.p1 gnl/MRDRNA2_/MRDRNA2_115864_c0~~gnl/MRDRNA2_/MRDRNA2_115864_c0_seq1.p1  ORF type:complete len:677 (+),score=123.75 gnl/MRDRNA2_/MRDRNA2_115864_c0_seq1:138-2168(+)
MNEPDVNSEINGNASSSGSRRSGYINGLDPNQKQTLDAFRKHFGSRIEHPRFTDMLLLRFLRARKFVLEDAIKMFDDHLNFRINAGLNRSMLPSEEAFPEIEGIKKYYPHCFHGVDRCGRPVYYERIGNLDVTQLLSICPAERVTQYFTSQSERQTCFNLPACSIARGELVEQIVTVLDLNGLSFRTVTHTTARKVLQAVTQINQNHFPEGLSCLIIVNAPKVFSMAWSFVKPMLDPTTVAKIQIFSSDPQKYTKRLFELIDPSNVPDFLGGSCKCPGGCMHGNKGPWKDPEICKMLAEKPYWELMQKYIGPDLPLMPFSSKREVASQAVCTSSSGYVDGNINREQQACIPPPLPVDFSRECSKDDDVFVSPLAQNAEALPDASLWPKPGPLIFEPGIKQSEDIGLGEIESEYVCLMEALTEAEQIHMQTLEKWLERSAEMTEQIGVRRIERAQRYYDGLNLRRQAEMRLDVLASEFQSFMQTYNERANELDLAEKQIVEHRKLSTVVSRTGEPDEGFVAQVTRLNDLTSEVASLTMRRNDLHMQYSTAMETLREAQLRSKELEQEHENCSWNCSVQVAKPYFMGRAQHEEVVEHQVILMESLQQRLMSITTKRKNWRKPQVEAESVVPVSQADANEHEVLTDYELRGPQVKASHGHRRDKHIEDGFFSCSEGEED